MEICQNPQHGSIPARIFPADQHLLIANGAFAIIQKSGGDHLRLCRLASGKRVVIEKLNFDPKDAIGKPFGMFEVGANGKTLRPIPVPFMMDSGPSESTKPVHTGINESRKMENGNGGGEDANSGGNQQKEIITPKQQLTAAEIAELKGTGIGTSGLVNKLVEGNTAFHERTVYSQQKYVQKKTQKHSDKLLISRPTIRLLCQTYYHKDPERLSHMRLDLLGLLLQLSAVHCGGCNVFVFEQALGLVGAAFLERLAGRGNCIFLHKGDWPQSIPCIDAMNFDEQQRSTFLPLRISTLLHPELLEKPKDDGGRREKGETTMEIEEEEKEGQKNGEEEEGEEGVPRKRAKMDGSDEFGQKRQQKMAKEKRALELMRPLDGGPNGQLDAICLAGRSMDPLDILQKVYPGLRLSGSLVVYSPIRQHLLGVWQWLRSTGSAVDIQLSQQLCRVHQVLPNRTHPLMQQPIAGGYVLQATKVVPAQPEQQQQQRRAAAAD